MDCSRIEGTGRDGRVRERDVVAHAERDRGQPLSPVRQAIARRMLHSLRTTAPVTLTTTADATNLVSVRSQFKAAVGVVPGYTDFFIKLAGLALRSHPSLNARCEDDRVLTSTEIHVGLAVDTDAGLVVPVVRHVAELTLRQIASRTRELIEKARQRMLRPEDLEGGTFTVSNLGPFGIDAFTPIIHPPQCAILGIGRIRQQATVHENQIVPRDVVTLSLTFDHRLVDGAPAARFLQTVCKGVENPAVWLID